MNAVVSFWRRAARLGLAIAALASFTGCISSRAFVPAEHVTAISPRGGHYAAEYPIIERGQGVGDVKLWSEGARRDASDDEPRTIVRVGFELENNAQTPLRLDPERLYIEELTKNGEAAGRVRVTRVEGDPRVAPGQRRQVIASFALPSSVWPSDVPGYRVAWTVVGERAHTRETPFLRAVEPGPDPWRRGPYYGWYYPGYYRYPGWYGRRWPYGYRGWPPPWRGRRYRHVPR